VSLLSTANWSDYTEYYVCLDVVTKTTFDQVAKLESQLKAKEQEIKQFILLEIEELKNIRNRTEVNGKAMNRCNKRIKELEQKMKEKSE